MVHAKILQIWQVKHVCHNLQLTLGTSLIEEGLKKLSAMYLRPAPVRVFPPLQFIFSMAFMSSVPFRYVVNVNSTLSIIKFTTIINKCSNTHMHEPLLYITIIIQCSPFIKHKDTITCSIYSKNLVQLTVNSSSAKLLQKEIKQDSPKGIIPMFTSNINTTISTTLYSSTDV